MKLVEQAFALALFAWLTEWNPLALLKWLSQPGKVLKAGAGLRKISCFGVNPHIVWEVTRRCNLRCRHCHAFGGEPSKELSTEEARELIQKLKETGIKTLVFSGGEPLLRKDIFTLISDATEKDFNIFIATNGTLITTEVARKLNEYDVGVVIGIDALRAEIHDELRGSRGAWKAMMRGIENCLRYDTYLHFNIVASRMNFEEVPGIIDFGNKIGVFSYFIYNFVPLGRGAEMAENVLTHDEFCRLLQILANKQRHSSGIIIPVAAPEYFAFLLMRKGVRRDFALRFIGNFISGCLAAECGMLYIKPDADIWRCPFLPDSSMGNALNLRILTQIHTHIRSQRHSACAACIYRYVCGGCAALSAGHETADELCRCALRRMRAQLTH